MADTIKTNLGPVTAYADAKAHGYTGTREEFGVLLANAGLNLKAAETAKADAEAAKTTASNSADAAANSATAAQESETNAGQSATAAAKSAADAKNTLESIPADYSTLSGKVDENASEISELKEEISANTAARHSHTNKAIIDGITGQVTADKVEAPDHITDLVQYGAFQIAAQQIISQIPTVPAVLPNPKALTIKIGSTTVTYDGSEAKTVDIADGSEVSY